MENTDTTTNSEAENAEIAENTDTANATKNKSTRNNPQTSAQSKPQTSGTNSDPATPAPPPASEKYGCHRSTKPSITMLYTKQ